MGKLDNRGAEANGFVPHDPNKLGQYNVFRSSTCFQELFYWAVLSTACQLWAAEINKLLLMHDALRFKTLSCICIDAYTNGHTIYIYRKKT